jgi:peroxiredoxin
MQPCTHGKRYLLPILFVLAWASPAVAISPGSIAPSFQLPWLTGEQAPDSDEIFGRAPLTALVFWNRDCPHCTEIALACDALADSLRPLGVAVTAILFGPDDPMALSYLLDEREIELPHLWDTGSVARAYGLGATHLASFLVDSHGTVQAAFDDRMEGLVSTLVPPARQWLAEMATGLPPSGGSGSDDERATRGAGAPTATKPATGEAGRPPATAPAARPIPGEATQQTAHAPATTVSLREMMELDARTRYAVTDGSRPDDRGLLGEPLEAGASRLHRVDVRLHWSPARGIEVVPWLRWSNEDEDAAMDGAEQFSGRHGTLSMILQRGRWHGTIGAFPLRLSPLLLQRWDREDAPPLGGATGCGVCGSGVTGITARSLEVLGPPYTFEGLEAGGTTRFARLRIAGAMARREQMEGATTLPAALMEFAQPESQLPSRYRKELGTAVLDLGHAGSVDAGTGLSRPLGLRLSALVLDDDRRSIDLDSHPRPADERDEGALSAWASAGPWRGATLEAEGAWWRLDRVRLEPPYGRPRQERTDARGFRAGTRVERAAGPWRVRGRLHFVRTEPGFEPFYRALTYSADREGSRAALTLAWTGREGTVGRRVAEGTDRLALELFHRALRETEDDPARRENPGAGRERETATSLSLSARARDDWPVELHLVRARADHPTPVRPGEKRPDETRSGVSLQLRCTAVPALEPSLRFDWIRIPAETSDLKPWEKTAARHTVRTVSIWMRVAG